MAMSQPQKQPSTTRHKVLTALGIALCVILVPLLIINVTLIIKSYVNPDEVPTLGGVAPLIVLTESMKPGIQPGDLIFVKSIEGSEVKEGDVIAFFDPASKENSILTHRVKEIREVDGTIYFTTWGDANGGAVDPQQVAASALVGIYTNFRIPFAGRVAIFMQSTAGLVICVFLPLVLLIGWDIFRRRRHEKKNQQDTEALLAELEALKAAKAAEASKEPAAEPAAAESEAAEPVAEPPAEAPTEPSSASVPTEENPQ
ncbi:MAG: signal peptidase I [Oscillospiraceae bacterium]|nr:signal peptidase I [Oscillospiraceae bacterium]